VNNIRFLKRKEIDLHQWDQAITSAINSLPYAFSWYLDSVAENWDALVMDDYKAIMPLVWMRKFGIKCLYQPYYCQQLGVFSNAILPGDILNEFIRTTTGRFYYININLNPNAGSLENGYKLKRKKNLLLDLSLSYPQLRKKYAGNHLRNVLKGEKSGLLLSENISLKKFQEFYLKNVNRSKENFKKKHEKIFVVLSDVLNENNRGKIFASIDADGQVLAAVMIIFHQQRIVNIINSSSDAGKRAGASHFLFDNIIRMYSASNYILDFEGSSIPGVARFYEGFGGVEEMFYNYKKVPLKLAE
jgi:hypothetical protein